MRLLFKFEEPSLKTLSISLLVFCQKLFPTNCKGDEASHMVTDSLMTIRWAFIFLHPSPIPQSHTWATCLVHGHVYHNVGHWHVRCSLGWKAVLVILSRDMDTKGRKLCWALDSYGNSKRKSTMTHGHAQKVSIAITARGRKHHSIIPLCTLTLALGHQQWWWFVLFTGQLTTIFVACQYCASLWACPASGTLCCRHILVIRQTAWGCPLMWYVKSDKKRDNSKPYTGEVSWASACF